MNIHVGKRLFLAAAVLGAAAVLAVALLVAPGLRSVVAGPDGGPAASAPNPGHSWSEIGDLPGTMWHSNNDGAGSGLDADTLDGLDSTAFSSPPWSAITGKPAGFADDIDNDVLGGLSCASGQIAKWGGSAWQCAADDTGTGNFWSLTGNSGTTSGNFLGTTDNQALELRVDSARALRLEPNATSPNVIGGYGGNLAAQGVVGATISGGGAYGGGQRVNADYGTVGGGNLNGAEGAYATVAGGYLNWAGGQGSAIGGGFQNGTGVGYSTVAGGYSNQATGGTATVGGGYTNSAGPNPGATVAGGNFNTASGQVATVGGGDHNVAGGYWATVGGGYTNIASGYYATVPGGTANVAQGAYSLAAGRRAKANHQGAFVWADSTDADFASTTADQFLVRASGGVSLNVTSGALRLEPNATSANVISGYSGNNATAGVVGAAICGGGASTGTNRVTDNYGTVAGGYNNLAGDVDGYLGDPGATVGGGRDNIASDDDATVGGGSQNTASGLEATISGGWRNNASSLAAAVGGGFSNNASNGYSTVGGGAVNSAGGSYATVGGGYSNGAGGYLATVGGGLQNGAGGFAATVSGGAHNSAAGDYSFAAGYYANANANGCFVWGDSTEAYVECNNDNRFIARASGGVYLYTSGDLSTGAYLAAGSGTWTDLSDRDLKDNFTPVDGQAVLASLAEIPVTTWNYKAQDAAIRHMGPVAQDFYAAFGLGDSETGISTVDADGVALAAIQGLYQLSQEQAARIQALEEENASLQQRLDDLEARVTALEGGARVSGASAGPLPSALTPGWLLLGGLFVAGLVVAQRRRAGGRR